MLVINLAYMVSKDTSVQKMGLSSRCVCTVSVLIGWHLFGPCSDFLSMTDAFLFLHVGHIDY